MAQQTEETVALEMFKQGIKRYVEEKVMPGEFLSSILANDLQAAFARADNAGLKALRALVMFVHNYVPSPICGNWRVLQEHTHSDKAYKLAQD